MARPRYLSDLTDAEWTRLESLIPAPQPGGRPGQHPRREIVNAVLSVLRPGCQRRALPHDLPPRDCVWWSFRQWRETDGWERVNPSSRERARMRVGWEPTPSAAMVASQSAKTTEKGGRAATTPASRSPGACARR